jgi:hypothetical protein
MPRGRSSSPSRSSSSTARGGAQSKVAPPQNNQVARSGMGAGIMGSIMSGMAFGAGAEFFRQLFRNPTTGSFMMPLILSGLTTWGAHRFLLKPSPYKGVYAGLIFVAAFIITKGMFNRGQGGDEYPQH